MKKTIVFSLLSIFLVACSQLEPKPPEPSKGHIDAGQTPKPATTATIPKVVQQAPILPEPSPATAELEKYTVVVNDVPVRELLFALARDAEVNVDIAPGIEGNVTINAVEQTLPQILDRISRQVDIRYEYKNDNLMVAADQPFLRSYVVDYVNIERLTDSQITIATQIATTGTGDVAEGSSGGGSGGNNNSTTDVRSLAANRFWETLVTNVQAILGEEVDSSSEVDTETPISNSVIPNPESGILSVLATSKQHEQVQQLIDKTVASVNRQVLVQATIVEVTLNDNYQAGIDWTYLSRSAGFSFSTAGLSTAINPLLGGDVGGIIGGILGYSDVDVNNEGDNLTATVNLLSEFGDTKVLSSPQMMVLNNQTAILKVVQNLVYFEIDSETTPGTLGSNSITSIDTTAKTVPVGIIMSVTPFISENDSVMLNIRPTISRKVADIPDPNPVLFQTSSGQPLAQPFRNNVPQIAVREMESMLRLNNGEIGVLGGLMTDETDDLDRGIPGVKDIPGVGEAFSSKRIQNTKTELVIFLRPIVINNPSLDGDLDLYRPFLESQTSLGTSGVR